MRKILLIVIIIFVLNFNLSYSVVKAEESSSSDNVDQTFNELIDGINEEDFKDLVDEINNLFGEDKSLKDIIILFLTGKLELNFDTLKNYFLSRLNVFFKFGGELLLYVIAIGIMFNFLNVISLKKCDNSLKSTLYFISVAIATVLIFKVIGNVFSYALDKLSLLTKTTQIVFPVMFSLSGLIGNFGVEQIKPFTVFLSVFFSSITTSVFMPLLKVETTLTTIGNLSGSINLDGFKKSISSIYKWLLLLACGLFSILIISQGVVNSQYNGLSVKILKYFTGSIIPIVGGFLSGGMEVLISSAVLIKNSIGLISVIYVLLTVGLTGLEILVFSFIVKLLASVCQPILDDKYYKIVIGITDVFNSVSALLFVSGFIFIITIFFIITATAYVF